MQPPESNPQASPGDSRDAARAGAHTVQPESFLTLHYRLAGPAGELINTFGGKPATLTIGSGQLTSPLEDCLLGLPEGTHRSFELPAGVAFGERKADMVQWVAAKLLRDLGDPREAYNLGDVVQFPTPDGLGQYAGTVVQVGRTDKSAGNEVGPSVGNEAVLFDFNHPLADQPVTFEVFVIGVL